jgi:hypothetical protein
MRTRPYYSWSDEFYNKIPETEQCGQVTRTWSGAPPDRPDATQTKPSLALLSPSPSNIFGFFGSFPTS